MTPRRGFESASKDSDIFSTPGDAGDTDSEAPTPDAIASLLRSGKKGGLTGLSLSSTRVSGRGELRRGKHHGGAINKPRRRRGKRMEMDRYSDDNGDDYSSSDEAEYGAGEKRKGRARRSAAAEWLSTHQNIPVVVSGYLRLFVQAAIVGLIIFFLFAGFRLVWQDMNHRIQEAAESVTMQIAECSKQYLQNRCAPDLRVPAMGEKCAIWEKCMSQDPAKVGRAKVSATTIADILNGFVNELHWKTLGLIVFVVVMCWIAGNYTAPNPTPLPPAAHYPTAAGIPPMPSHWTPHRPTADSYPFTPQQAWATPLTTRKRPLFGQGPKTPFEDGNQDKALEWR